MRLIVLSALAVVSESFLCSFSSLLSSSLTVCSWDSCSRESLTWMLSSSRLYANSDASVLSRHASKSGMTGSLSVIYWSCLVSSACWPLNSDFRCLIRDHQWRWWSLAWSPPPIRLTSLSLCLAEGEELILVAYICTLVEGHPSVWSRARSSSGILVLWRYSESQSSCLCLPCWHCMWPTPACYTLTNSSSLHADLLRSDTAWPRTTYTGSVIRLFL